LGLLLLEIEAMGDDRERIKNPLNALVMILNSSWRRKRIGYISMYSCELRLDDIPIVVLEDIIEPSPYDTMFFASLKHHTSLFWFTKSSYDLLIYVQDDVRLARAIYDNLLLCEEAWMMLHGNRDNVPLMLCPGYVCTKGHNSMHIDRNLPKLYEQVNKLVCGDVMRYGGQVMIVNRALCVRVFENSASVLSKYFDDVIWRSAARKVWVMVPSQFQHINISSTWKARYGNLRCIDYDYWQDPAIRFEDAENMQKHDRETLAQMMQEFWRYARGCGNDVTVSETNYDAQLIEVADRIVRKVEYYVGGEKGERIWHSYLSFKSHLRL
jgi:hypothetical protein